MGHLAAVILGIVEGLTEYLPVSSTGHLILAGHYLGLEGEGTQSFQIAIQLGAVLAVVVHYRELLGQKARGVLEGSRASLNLVLALFAGFLPLAILGLLLHRTVKAHLFGPIPVALALVLGGVVMIAIERSRARKALVDGPAGLVGLEHVTPKRALLIGFGQCFALWPGTSRSMCTIVAGQLSGLSTATAAEFSFLLALPTLGAATVYEVYKGRESLLAQDGAMVELAIGMVVSFFVAWGVIAAFLRYLTRRGLEPFGYYRILLGLLVFWLIAPEG